MPLPTCAVACTVHDQTGQPVPGARIEAVLNRYEVYQGHVVPARVDGITDALGTCTLDLWPNQLGSTESAYTVKIFSPNGKRVDLIAVVPNFANANLHEIATLPVYPGKLDGQASIEAAQAAGNTAIVAMQASQAAAAASEASRAAAVVAQAASESSATASAGSSSSASSFSAASSVSATASAGSATASSNSATSASGFATAASGSATAAATSATNAQASAVAAADSVNAAALVRNVDNKIINGDFWVDQLVLSGTITLAAGQGGVDGWRAGSAGCVYTRDFSLGTWTITIISGSLRQSIYATDVPTGNYTLSWSGTSGARVYALAAPGAYTAGPIAFSHSFGSGIVVEFNPGTVRYVQFQAGTIATAFEPRTDELQRCQKRRWKTYEQGTAPGTATLVGARATNNTVNAPFGAQFSLVFPVEMLGVPTFTFYNPVTGAAGSWRSGAADHAMGNGGIPPGTNSGVVGNSAAISTVGQALYGHVVAEVAF